MDYGCGLRGVHLNIAHAESKKGARERIERAERERESIEGREGGTVLCRERGYNEVDYVLHTRQHVITTRQ